MATQVLASTKLLIGKCVPCVKQNAAKIRYTRLDFDSYFLMYFKKFDHVYAYDPEQKVKTGDIVLVRELPEKVTTLITHSIEEIVHKYGDIVDPITGKLSVVSKYREQIEEANKMYGKLDSAFDYSKAPPRGRLEGKLDFTDKPVTTRYHDDGKEDPYTVVYEGWGKTPKK